MVNLNDSPSTPSTVDSGVNMDAAHLAPDDVEAFLYAMESTAVQAALDPGAATGFPHSRP